jgi:hypothetical protein
VEEIASALDSKEVSHVHVDMDACDHSKQGLESEIPSETQNDPESEVFCLPTTYIQCAHSRSLLLRSSLPCYSESVYSITRVQVDLCSYGTQLKPSSDDVSI